MRFHVPTLICLAAAFFSLSSASSRGNLKKVYKPASKDAASSQKLVMPKNRFMMLDDREDTSSQAPSTPTASAEAASTASVANDAAGRTRVGSSPSSSGSFQQKIGRRQRKSKMTDSYLKKCSETPCRDILRSGHCRYSRKCKYNHELADQIREERRVAAAAAASATAVDDSDIANTPDSLQKTESSEPLQAVHSDAQDVAEVAGADPVVLPNSKHSSVDPSSMARLDGLASAVLFPFLLDEDDDAEESKLLNLLKTNSPSSAAHAQDSASIDRLLDERFGLNAPSKPQPYKDLTVDVLPGCGAASSFAAAELRRELHAGSTVFAESKNSEESSRDSRTTAKRTPIGGELAGAGFDSRGTLPSSRPVLSPSIANGQTIWSPSESEQSVLWGRASGESSHNLDLRPPIDGVEENEMEAEEMEAHPYAAAATLMPRSRCPWPLVPYTIPCSNCHMPQTILIPMPPCLDPRHAPHAPRYSPEASAYHSGRAAGSYASPSFPPPPRTPHHYQQQCSPQFHGSFHPMQHFPYPLHSPHHQSQAPYHRPVVPVYPPGFESYGDGSFSTKHQGDGDGQE